MHERIVIAEPVAEALAAGGPVVALETTVITHGLPSPAGLRAAETLEADVREGGAVPATIGVLDGRVRVGLTAAQLEQLGGARGTVKVNLSNLAAVVASGMPGSTTVAATAFVASCVGIRVFATGGIGGVHRGSEQSGDVSGDLAALARIPIAVVCAGAKAVLDLGRTVQMLETLGVPVLGFGTDEFPAFYRRSSGLPVDRRFDDLGQLALAVRVHFQLGIGSGVVVANPIPVEHELPREQYDAALATALAEAAASDVRGRDVTPFLLGRLRELTEERSVFSNLGLLRHNAQVAAALARELQEG
ncbi:MAG: pseudouridine-5-phosphate glycosidase [Candidatus Eisenbacteria bacterium RBG_16_71_46]|nr:MAG: pseudouridine-5-phosphate glycosidase [Candidatus Eisenbacteria bacterium RBG_16_71_46]OGF24704.1 MAG: pseudouridine-5-phosphate glycosidase [Candidatus Eisenbacteria bacterium RBG_19FT_COMBO_70_11]